MLYTTGEILLLSVCKEMRFILGPEADSEISLVPLPSDTNSHRVSDISRDIKNLMSGLKSVQIDQSTDINCHVRLIANIRYIDGERITSDLGCSWH